MVQLHCSVLRTHTLHGAQNDYIAQKEEKGQIDGATKGQKRKCRVRRSNIHHSIHQENFVRIEMLRVQISCQRHCASCGRGRRSGFRRNVFAYLLPVQGAGCKSSGRCCRPCGADDGGAWDSTRRIVPMTATALSSAIPSLVNVPAQQHVSKLYQADDV